jgi:hypothetical protein
MKKRVTLLFAMFAALVTTASAQISVSPLTIAQDGNAELTVNLKNDEVVKGIQFTLTLPKGVTVPGSDTGITYSDGNTQTTYTPSNSVKVELTSRTKGWWVLGNKISESDEGNVYKFVLIDPSVKGLAAGNGEIMKISFKAAENADLAKIEDGIKLTDIHESVAGSTNDTAQADVSADLTIANFIKGDCNGNGEIEINDPVKLLEYLADIHEGNFVEAAADINGNGEIDITDPVWLLEYLADMRELSRGTLKQQENGKETDWNLPDPD